MLGKVGADATQVHAVEALIKGYDAVAHKQADIQGQLLRELEVRSCSLLLLLQLTVAATGAGQLSTGVAGAAAVVRS